MTLGSGKMQGANSILLVSCIDVTLGFFDEKLNHGQMALLSSTVQGRPPFVIRMIWIAILLSGN